MSVVTDIMSAVSRYSGVPYAEIRSSRHSTVAVRRARAMAYVIARGHLGLLSMSDTELCRELGKHRGYQDRVKATISKHDGTPWWARGVAYLREQFP